MEQIRVIKPEQEQTVSAADLLDLSGADVWGTEAQPV